MPPRRPTQQVGNAARAAAKGTQHSNANASQLPLGAAGDDDEGAPILPVGSKGHVACKRCRFVLDATQFIRREGCPRCHSEMDKESVKDAATPNFSGFVGVVDARHSWVARLIRCGADAPHGVYAANIDVSDEDEDEEEGDDAEGEEEVGSVEVIEDGFGRGF